MPSVLVWPSFTNYEAGLVGESTRAIVVLITDGKNPEAIEKLNILAGTVDGFKIAEEDLRMRGPGEVLGTRQSGTGRLAVCRVFVRHIHHSGSA